MTRVIRIRQRGWIAGWGVVKEEKSRRDISAAKRHRKPSTAPSHPIRLIPAHPPLYGPYLNNNCSVATLPPDALPSAHQTSMAWVHLVPCDAFSQSLIYKEINGLHNNKGLNAQISMSLPHPSTTQFIPMQVTNRDPRSGHRLQLLSCPADELQVPDWLGLLSYKCGHSSPSGRSEL